MSKTKPAKDKIYPEEKMPRIIIYPGGYRIQILTYSTLLKEDITKVYLGGAFGSIRQCLEHFRNEMKTADQFYSFTGSEWVIAYPDLDAQILQYMERL